MAGHNALARRIGWSEEDLAALEDETAYSRFSGDVAVALTYAGRMTRDARTVSDELFALMKSHYTDTQILEITSVISIANYFNRLTTALRIDPSGSSRTQSSKPAPPEPTTPSKPAAR